MHRRPLPPSTQVDKVLLGKNNVAMSGARIPVAREEERDDYFYADR